MSHHSEGSLQSALNTASIWDRVSKFRDQKNRTVETGDVERKRQLEKTEICTEELRGRRMEEFPGYNQVCRNTSVSVQTNK